MDLALLLSVPARSEGPDHHDSGPAQRPKANRRRTHITPVACQPCQQRKHKCDGARPICTPCVARQRTDCFYNVAGDQRRTTSLKQRIRDLESQTQGLKDILAGISRANDHDAAIELAQQLVANDFRNTQEVSHTLRRDENVIIVERRERPKSAAPHEYPPYGPTV
ncbi:hypothetical protein B0J12DRAFT_706023 [Macrophomina phaseolina]|uniref:Zn(2)-C6 fungal-type domain-containing protein n=1 Tax=Macrophomina phaseolina TaxID=35725 RepID=A0ABQ8FT81_9PEZI|nr:hypothetical protein B0J12DRAFT_706023 [Macrophomina phaseolina]